MALPKLLEDLAFISKLGDYPGSDDNLTPEQFRDRFDAAALRIQEYLNNQLVPGLDQLVDVQALLNGILDSTLSLSDRAANAKATGDALIRKLDKTGGNMTGNIDMGGKRVGNLGTPVSTGDAASKGYVDAKHAVFTVSLPASGWTGSGPFTQTVSVDGILNTDRPHWDVVLSSDTATAVAELEEYSVVDKLETSNGSLTFTCLQEKPKADLTIQMEVNR
jgi:hypothetical protein